LWQGKSEEEQRTANINRLKLGGSKDFLYDANLEGINVARGSGIRGAAWA